MIRLLKISLLKLMFVAAATLLAFACTKDDSTKGGSSANNWVITTNDGTNLLLKRIDWDDGVRDNLSFDYDETGRPTSVVWEDNLAYSISYDPYTITLYSIQDQVVYPTSEAVSLSFTSAGYVSKIAYNYEDDDYYEWVTINFTYDSDGHITREIWSAIDSEYGDWGETEEFTWSHGNLTKCDWSDTDGDFGTITFEYGSVNEYQQPTYAFNDVIGIVDLYYPLGFVVSFGVPSTNLLSSESEGDWQETFSYTKNTDGTIRTEALNGGEYVLTYSYYTLDDYTRSGATMYSNDEEDLSSRENHVISRAQTLRHHFVSPRMRREMEISSVNSME